MWAGGEVVFHPGWGDKLVLDGRPWSCDERIGEVVLRNDKVFVDVWRRYGLGHGDPGARPRWDIEERRTLVFLKSAVAPSTRLIRHGHRDLLVHGPLTLALMLDALPPVASISYRNYAPLYVNERLRVCVRRPERPRKPWDVWVEGPDGGLAVKATAEVLS
ncbi:uncharacterized protein UV8b_06593 [Ustilaginoidea virens]|uniref:Uncharacterized protein n=1 Tax=Ustilaginoidea virens TaxID=1159556 RepID=A0A8E5MJR2_USTVR|nr:uncharacterized protein UV8b_06593 [Ustilaginoidea virens]QUC22352.1 hypothetical protein UV8b_06593 [Ustilaginoidea virens]